MKDYYKILKIERSASMDAVKVAYRNLARKYHPDVNDTKEAIAIMQDVNEAYEVLSVQEKRDEYDALLQFGGAEAKSNVVPASPMRTPSQQDIQNAFEKFFGFHPKSTEPMHRDKSGASNPMDTSDLFEAFMKGRKKQ